MSKWVSSWGIPTSYVVEGVGNVMVNTSFRHVFYNPINGKKIRIRFSNKYGKNDVRIDGASIAEWTGNGPEIVLSTLADVTFKDNGNVIRSGEELLSDEIDFETVAEKNYVISYYFKEPTEVATGYNKFANDKFAPCWLGRGDFTRSESFPLNNRREIQSYVFLCGVDVLSNDDTYSIMAFGDSITARPWPDLLVRRINQEGYKNRSVIRKAIGGNRILRDYRNCLPRRHMGISAVERFEMSLKQTAGVKKVIMLEGINDLFHPQKDSLFSKMDDLPTFEEMLEGYKKCCDIAHKHGVKFYLATILPTNYMLKLGNGREDIRLRINEWIRNNDYTDGFIEFEQAVMDKNDPHILAPEYDSGDTLHPSEEGSMMLCNAVPADIYN